MSKVVYIIPGFRDEVSQKKYRRVAAIFEAKGVKAVPVKIHWNKRVMSDYVAEFLSQVRHKKGDEVYVLGFSFGSIIAFISAAVVKPDLLFLCSLSPYFKEDLGFVKKSWRKQVGKRRLEDFGRISFDELVKGVKCKTVLFLGDKEILQLPRRVRARLAHEKMKGSELVVVKGARHDIGQKEYLEALREVVSSVLK